MSAEILECIQICARITDLVRSHMILKVCDLNSRCAIWLYKELWKGVGKHPYTIFLLKYLPLWLL